MPKVTYLLENYNNELSARKKIITVVSTSLPVGERHEKVAYTLAATSVKV